MAQVTGKKVATTPMPTPTGTSGAIIDSFNTQDDKTVNAPSIHIVEDAITTINDNLSELTKYQFGNVVDIKSYTYDEPYTCPSDGYIWITSGSKALDYTYAKLNNTFIVSAYGNTGNGGITTCFVKKGMTVGIKTNSGNDCQAKFYPLA